MTYIGVILAVFTALFIVRWENLIKNKKSLKIQWNHSMRGSQKEISWKVTNETKEDKNFNYILLKINNIGNRMISISHILLEFYNKNTVVLSTHYFYDKTYTETDIKFPCKLDVEEFALLHIPIDWFCGMIKTSLDNDCCKSSDKIIIAITDTADKTYKIKTSMTFGYYMQYFDNQKVNLR
jgi:hypothetical protein